MMLETRGENLLDLDDDKTVLDRKSIKLLEKLESHREQILFLVIGLCFGLLIGLYTAWRVSKRCGEEVHVTQVSNKNNSNLKLTDFSSKV